ncbi:MAG: hypothetical protein M5R42_03610 [Rhodocyclaceae bacterium]|nr:hypothetical protein [Rhodocyclaceae bacterium]
MLATHPGLPPGARGAVQDLAYTALRRCGRDDFFMTRMMEKMPPPAVRALLITVLARLEARPEDAHTVVNQAVEAACTLAQGKYKALTNGVLRNFLRRCDELIASAVRDEAAHWQHPRWWIAAPAPRLSGILAGNPRGREQPAAHGAAWKSAPYCSG